MITETKISPEKILETIQGFFDMLKPKITQGKLNGFFLTAVVDEGVAKTWCFPNPSSREIMALLGAIDEAKFELLLDLKLERDQKELKSMIKESLSDLENAAASKPDAVH